MSHGNGGAAFAAQTARALTVIAVCSIMCTVILVLRVLFAVLVW